jgi:predicted nucleotidyltransferase
VTIDWIPPSQAVAAAIRDLQANIASVLGPRLLALYLSGSAVLGDFDEGLSDIDLLAVTTSALPPDEVDALRTTHDTYDRDHPPWVDRVEVIYVSAADLRDFRTARPAFPVISPGEPFHLREELLADWAANWFLIRRAGVPLAGPPAAELIPDVSEREFFGCLSRYLGDLQQRLTQPISPTLSDFFPLALPPRWLSW